MMRDMHDGGIRAAGFDIRCSDQFRHLATVEALSDATHPQGEEVARTHTALTKIAPMQTTQADQTRSPTTPGGARMIWPTALQIFTKDDSC
mmetsp:Transcript_2823/g.6880  ORF Transcript_2823/g.6880 Transcript_2823/m.6880 type:complete len:91 (-) Transcript_2823:49-321(-)